MKHLLTTWTFYENICDICDWDIYDFAAIIPQDTQLGNEIENNLRWTINLGTSYWKTNALSDFMNFCIDTYTNNKELLREKWDFHQKYSYPGGVCEMSLAYLWVENRNTLRTLNLSNPGNACIHFNGDINGSENYLRRDYCFSRFLNIKRIKFINHKPLLRRLNGDYVPVANLHFSGNAKLLMNDYAKVEHIKLKTFITYALYAIKRHGGIIYRKLKRSLK